MTRRSRVQVVESASCKCRVRLLAIDPQWAWPFPGPCQWRSFVVLGCPFVINNGLTIWNKHKLINIYPVQVTCGTLGLSTATVKLVSSDGSMQVACSVGTGPVDSAYKAVDMIVKVWSFIYSWLLLTFASFWFWKHIVLLLVSISIFLAHFLWFSLRYLMAILMVLVSEDSHFNVQDCYGLLPCPGIVVST